MQPLKNKNKFGIIEEHNKTDIICRELQDNKYIINDIKKGKIEISFKDENINLSITEYKESINK